MAERKSGFLGVTAALLALAFIAGFAIALASIGKSGVLYKFAIAWESTRALLYLANWAPAILLVASALAMESSEAVDGFSEAAYGVLAPALFLAAAISIFYLLVVPNLEERANRYESQSALFTDSLGLAEASLRTGALDAADRNLRACAAIDPLDERYVALNDRVQSAIVKEEAAKADAAARLALGQARETGEPWAAGNRFYLEALKARDEGRVFDAHYLAKRSYAIYSKRPEVKRLVDETWRALERLNPSAENVRAAALYGRKLEGYKRFQEGDYLEAFRIYSELAVENRDDDEVRTWLARSEEALATVAFFIEEDEQAFARSDERPFSMTVSGSGAWTMRLSASRAAISEEAVYFRDLVLTRTGTGPLSVSSPFARLHGNLLVLKAINRVDARVLGSPTYDSVTPAGGARQGEGNTLRLSFDQNDAATVLRLSGDPADIPLALLATGTDDAQRFGLEVEPLRAELASRAAYPFSVLMLALIGAGLGIRFKSTEKPGTAMKYLSAPILVALAIGPLRIVAGIASVAARAFATLVPGSMLLPAWLGFLGLCVAGSLILAARIAGAPR
ncbi:MAG: hypothetical protein CVV51_12630 [Spirochaetae bacterium HGW-Spirochaetae-7]|nr:MAG: hypothetical protein CVV51_12630 [Spirochaetae bacterium HGW-Spirochaetae-7]